MYTRLLALRRELGNAPVDDVAFDEDERWLVVRRAGVQLAMNFARDERTVPVRGGTVVLAPLSGEVVR
jgi:hypothetical protein